MERLTNEVLLTSANLQAYETHDARSNSKSTQSERKSHASGVPQHALCEKYDRDGVDDEVASQVERKVQDEGLRRIKHGACTFLLGPLYGYGGSAKESIVKENGQVARDDESGKGEEHLAQARVTREVEKGPVKRQHAEFGKAHADIVEVVGSEGDLLSILLAHEHGIAGRSVD